MISRPHLARPLRWRTTVFQTTRLYSTPPPHLPYRPAPPREEPRPVEPDLPPVRRSWLSRLLGRKEPGINDHVPPEPPDPVRGREASQRVVREGILDPRYREGAKRYTRLIVASPIAIFLTYELYRRRFLGVEQKLVPPPKARVETGKEGG